MENKSKETLINRSMLQATTRQRTGTPPPFTLNAEVVSALMASAKAKEAGNEPLLSGLQDVLDKAQLRDSSLEDEIMEPIKKRALSKRRSQAGPNSTEERTDTVSPFK